MPANRPFFALNHMSVPQQTMPHFFALAAGLGMRGVEIRNDLAGNAILDGTPPGAVRAAAQAHGLRLLSINALQRFNDWTAARAEEARSLIAYARACGAEALVLVPVNDGTGRANGERQANLRIALKALRPLLEEAGILGLVEPLGFEACSLRRKSEAAEAIAALGAQDRFRLVHDTFHHCLAGEEALFVAETGLVHISGVEDGAVALGDMRDGHRVLVGRDDRLGNVAQIAALLDGGYGGAFSFEPFAPGVHGAADPRGALLASMAHIREGLSRVGRAVENGISP